MKLDLKKIKDVQLDGIDHHDYPDFVDAFISYATLDGIELTDDQLNSLNDDSDFVYECVMNQLF